MNEFQIRSLFENRFGGTPESFGLSIAVDDAGAAHLVGNGHVVTLEVVNNQQVGWRIDGAMHCQTPPSNPVLKPLDPARQSNGAALRAALA